MVGLGTLLNVGGILLGGLLGLLLGRRLETRFQDTLTKAMGICVLFIGMGGALEQLLSGSDTMMLVGSFAAGALLGELIDLQRRLEQFGTWLKAKTGSSGDKSFVEGFVTASLTVCIGAMSIVGSIQDGLLGDYSTLALKAVLDLVIILVMTTALGKGCIFSALPVALLQGSVTALAGLLEPLMTDQALANLSLTGSILIFCVGLNLIWERTVKVANMLPAILVAAAWAFFAP